MGILEKIGLFLKAEKIWKTKNFFCEQCGEPVALVHWFFVKEPVIIDNKTFWQKYGFVIRKHDCKAFK